MPTGENKTALMSRRAFGEALLRLMERKPYRDISVSELCQQSGLSRQTFYSLFGSKDRVLTHAIRHHYNAPPEIPLCQESVRDIPRLFSIYVDANYAFLKLLTDNDLMHIFYNCCVDTFTESWELPLPQEPQPYLRVYLAGVLSGVVDTYLRQDIRREPEYLEALLRQLLDGSYFHS